jgi:nicotinamide phosphoribosyltransferase
MGFKINSLYLTDGYKVGHQKMLAPGTTKLYGTWIPRSVKHAPKGIEKIVSFGQQLVWKWLHDEFEENFFMTELVNETINSSIKEGNSYDYAQTKSILPIKEKALQFVKDMSLYLGMEYDGKHFEDLWDLGYLPIKVKALPEGVETNPNIPHMTFVNTVDGFAWLTLYLETIVSSLAWKPSTIATIAKLYRKQAEEWVMKTDKENIGLVPFMCHDFSARGLDPMSQILCGLGWSTSFLGSDTLPVIPASRYFYGVKEDEMPIYSVNASEHSVSTTKIFTVGEQQMIADWLELFPQGILSIVSDTFDLWKLITEYLPANKEAIMARDGKLVIRPDSGNPVDIICGQHFPGIGVPDYPTQEDEDNWDFCEKEHYNTPQGKGVIELLWDIFGGTVNEQGYKVLDPHIGCIYGDSITVDRQLEIYKRLEAKGFAATNIILGVGSYTMQYNTRDTLGFAAKGAWFQVKESVMTSPQSIGYDIKSYNIYKDPITDDGTKKSLKGLLCVTKDDMGEYIVLEEMTSNEESQGDLQVIYEDGKFFNQTTLDEIRERIRSLSNKFLEKEVI